MTREAVQPPLPLNVPEMPQAVRAELRTQIEPRWGDEAACASEWVNPDWWFTPADDRSQTAARTICGSCTVRGSCLAHALATSELHGIWGGLDETERAWLLLALAEGTRVAAVLDPHSWTAVA